MAQCQTGLYENESPGNKEHLDSQTLINPFQKKDCDQKGEIRKNKVVFEQCKPPLNYQAQRGKMIGQQLCPTPHLDP